MMSHSMLFRSNPVFTIAFGLMCEPLCETKGGFAAVEPFTTCKDCDHG